MGILRSALHNLFPNVIRSNEQVEADRIKAEEARQREIKRKNTLCVFSEMLTKSEFEQIVVDVAKPIKRLTVKTDNQFVTGIVRTQSGIDTWEFCLDFNDFGIVTGRYWWVNKGNTDSKIPESYAKQLQYAIVSYIDSKK